MSIGRTTRPCRTPFMHGATAEESRDPCARTIVGLQASKHAPSACLAAIRARSADAESLPDYLELWAAGSPRTRSTRQPEPLRRWRCRVFDEDTGGRSPARPDARGMLAGDASQPRFSGCGIAGPDQPELVSHFDGRSEHRAYGHGV